MNRELGREVSLLCSVCCSCGRKEKKPPGALRLCNSEEKRAVHRELGMQETLVVEVQEEKNSGSLTLPHLGSLAKKGRRKYLVVSTICDGLGGSIWGLA